MIVLDLDRTFAGDCDYERDIPMVPALRFWCFVMYYVYLLSGVDKGEEC